MARWGLEAARAAQLLDGKGLGSLDSTNIHPRGPSEAVRFLPVQSQGMGSQPQGQTFGKIGLLLGLRWDGREGLGLGAGCLLALPSSKRSKPMTLLPSVQTMPGIIPTQQGPAWMPGLGVSLFCPGSQMRTFSEMQARQSGAC